MKKYAIEQAKWNNRPMACAVVQGFVKLPGGYIKVEWEMQRESLILILRDTGASSAKGLPKQWEIDGKAVCFNARTRDGERWSILDGGISIEKETGLTKHFRDRDGKLIEMKTARKAREILVQAGREILESNISVAAVTVAWIESWQTAEGLRRRLQEAMDDGRLGSLEGREERRFRERIATHEGEALFSKNMAGKVLGRNKKALAFILGHPDKEVRRGVLGLVGGIARPATKPRALKR